MTILEYLETEKYAASNLIGLIWKEYNDLQKLEQEVDSLKGKVEDGYRRAEHFMMDDDPDDVMLGLGIHWETYFGDDKELFHKNKDKIKLEEQIEAHKASIQTLCSALLQIAKQGISICYGGLSNCQDGRPVGSQRLKDVLWQARNQTMHYEEGACKDPIVVVFSRLAIDFNAIFNNYNLENLAFEIVKVLDWKNYENFANDLQSFG